jgi:hypothetical protein
MVDSTWSIVSILTIKICHKNKADPRQRNNLPGVGKLNLFKIIGTRNRRMASIRKSKVNAYVFVEYRVERFVNIKITAMIRIIEM